MRKLNLVFMFLLFVTGTMTVLSCENDETVTVTLETNIPEVHFEYDNYWAFVANGEYLTLDNLHINDSTSSEGIAIRQVDFYLDGELVSSSLVSPFSLRYLIQDRSVGEHQLMVVVQVTGGGYSDITCRFNLAVYVQEEPFALRAGLVFDNPPVDGVVHNGDILSGHVEVVENSIGATMERVEYYWDDKLLHIHSNDIFHRRQMLCVVHRRQHPHGPICPQQFRFLVTLWTKRHRNSR